MDRASEVVYGFRDHLLDVVDITRPTDIDYAVHLAKVVSKLSPLLGNMTEYRVVAQLNQSGDWEGGHWIRQDPGFPDALFVGGLNPSPGMEIKTWFPLSTEITARFRDSIVHFEEDQTRVALLAWLPEFVIYGQPRVIDVWIDSARSVAEARDRHYHNPPDYIVFEPEDTTARTGNLQQTNVNGYKFQDTAEKFREAEAIVASWGVNGAQYSAAPEHQTMLRQLLAVCSYRLDTNFAKMDRIEHPTLEEFKTRVLSTLFRDRTIAEWAHIVGKPESTSSKAVLAQLIA